MVVMRSSGSLCISVDALRCAKSNNIDKLASCVPISAKFKNKKRALFVVEEVVAFSWVEFHRL